MSLVTVSGHDFTAPRGACWELIGCRSLSRQVEFLSHAHEFQPVCFASFFPNPPNSELKERGN